MRHCLRFASHRLTCVRKVSIPFSKKKQLPVTKTEEASKKRNENRERTVFVSFVVSSLADRMLMMQKSWEINYSRLEGDSAPVWSSTAFSSIRSRPRYRGIARLLTRPCCFDGNSFWVDFLKSLSGRFSLAVSLVIISWDTAPSPNGGGWDVSFQNILLQGISYQE